MILNGEVREGLTKKVTFGKRHEEERRNPVIVWENTQADGTTRRPVTLGQSEKKSNRNEVRRGKQQGRSPRALYCELFQKETTGDFGANEWSDLTTFLLIFGKRERKGEREREKCQFVVSLIYAFTGLLLVCPKQGSNLQPRCVRTTLSPTKLPGQGLATFVKDPSRGRAK